MQAHRCVVPKGMTVGDTITVNGDIRQPKRRRDELGEQTARDVEGMVGHVQAGVDSEAINAKMFIERHQRALACARMHACAVPIHTGQQSVSSVQFLQSLEKTHTQHSNGVHGARNSPALPPVCEPHGLCHAHLVSTQTAPLYQESKLNDHITSTTDHIPVRWPCSAVKTGYGL